MARHPRNRKLLVPGLAGLSGGDAGGGAAAGCAAASRFGRGDHRDRQGLRVPGAVHLARRDFPATFVLSRAIKQANPNIKIAFVGPHVSVLPEKSLRDCPEIDFICRKEFDYAVVDYAKGKPLAEIPGVSFLKDGKIVHNPDAPQIQDLDALPHVTDVYKRDLDVTRYNVPFLLNPFVSLYTTRGCPAQCTFCLWPQTLSGHPWRKRSTDDVAREMAKAKEMWPNVKEFFFDDDTFNIQKARTIELCAKLKPLGLTWSCTSRVTTDFETLKAMKEAGCRLLIVGYESGDQQILKNIKKGATIERARQFTKDCHKLGLVIHGDFIMGLPGETHETINNTHRLRQGTGRRNHSGFGGARLSRHRALRLRGEERIHGRRQQDGRRGRTSAGADSVSRPAG